MLQGFNDDDLYLIDKSYLNSPAELVYEITLILDTERAKNKKIKLKIGSIDLSHAQLSSIKSLLLSINSSLEVLDGTSEITRNSAIEEGILFENSADIIPAETAFINEIQNNTPENNQDNETFSETPSCEQQNEQDFQIQESDRENETNCSDEANFQNENNNQNEFNSQTETNFQDENTNENVTDENQPQEQFEDFRPEETHYEEVQQQEQPQENNQIFEPVSEEPAEIPAPTAETSEFSNEINIENEENFAENEENNSSEIPESSVIQEELSIIYGKEKKLEDVFESTGIKESKFASFKDAATAEEREYTKFDFELEAFPTKYLKQNICAGQVISYDGHLVIIGDCHEGSEISASGDITVWGDLSGSAYAGMNGNEKAKIRALRMNASQLRISTCSISRPDALENPETAGRHSIPEEASINKGEIGVYKIFK